MRGPDLADHYSENVHVELQSGVSTFCKGVAAYSKPALFPPLPEARHCFPGQQRSGTIPPVSCAPQPSPQRLAGVSCLLGLVLPWLLSSFARTPDRTGPLLDPAPLPRLSASFLGVTSASAAMPTALSPPSYRDHHTKTYIPVLITTRFESRRRLPSRE
ncbi:hypothetical protein B0H15DRAFT_956237 [Mycena belliarum]|uniref:Uncharacterized protein n=1 Tax=Mycena belliarum TaxID=1033014 RepID=A0AAD6TQ09_9AGAR|nr:hypothetical protein B0H15DRAFT_956237 [Mycena belliae]